MSLETDRWLDFLRRRLTAITGIDASHLTAGDALVAVGLDSLAAVELESAVEEELGISLPLEGLLDGATLGEVAAILEAGSSASPAEPAAGAGSAGILGSLEDEAEDSPPDELPLSAGQEGLWFLSRLDPASAAYHIVVVARISEASGGQGPAASRTPPDVPALERAVGDLVARHGGLRTTFVAQDGAPRQRVHGSAPGQHPGVPVVVEDGRSLAGDELLERLREEAYRPFDLAAGPLLRVRLWQRDEEPWTALVVVHHAVADFWTLGLLGRELGALYRLHRGTGPALPPPSRHSYGDFVHWQREMLAGPRGAELAAAWRERLADAPEELELPTDHPRPPFASHRGGTEVLSFGSALPRVEALARGRGATPFMVLLAAFQVLLSRLSGQRDLLVGTPTSGRGQPAWREVMGYFVNPVVLRGNLRGGPTFAAFLERTRRGALEAFAQQDYPFPLLARELAPRRDSSRPPLVQVLFVWQRAQRREERGLAALALGVGGGPMRLGDLELLPQPWEELTAPFDLTLRMAEVEGDLVAALQYSRDLYEPLTARRWLGQLRRLLEVAIAEPERPIAHLPLLSVAEAHQLRFELNDTAVSALQATAPAGRLAEPELDALLEMRLDARLDAPFRARCREMPEAVALLSEDEHWSYRELGQRAAEVAARLARLGVGPEVRVGILFDRGPELVMAVLGVLAAGGAYVPLDPAYPAERVGFMLRDSGARALITDRILGDEDEGAGKTVRAFRRAGNPVLHLARRERDPPPRPSLPPSRRGQGEGLAYIIYTSGSTGRPKGVAITHSNATAMLRWALRTYPPAALSRTVAATSVCFDLSIFELFVPLSAGGTVLLVASALALPEAPFAAGATLLNTVPSAAAELIAAGRLPASVRTVNLAGEPLPGGLVDRLYALGSVDAVFNLYGPSEDTTYSTWARIPRHRRREPSIGRPVTGTRAWVVDADLQPLPVGVPGELVLGGAGLARGYLGRPALTADRFVPDPFVVPTLEAGGGRLYRTGDRVRWHRDGDLEFLGRFDHQVKLRGFRIELGEVEAALLRHPEVTETVVVARGVGVEQRMVAYVAGDGGGDEAARSAALRASLRRTLPEYMLPSQLVFVPALPRTPNGKVDRRALPEPDWKRPESGEEVAPRTPTEELVAGIWADLLGRERIGVTANFFALGGHSLLATRAASRLHQALGIEIPVAELFAAQTAAELAARIDALRGEAHEEDSGMLGQETPSTAAPALAESAGPLPLSFAQERLWFLEQLQPASPLYNIAGSLHLEGELSVASLARAVGEIVRRHQVLRSRFTPGADGPQAFITPWRPLAVPVVDLSTLAGGDRSRAADALALAEAQLPFNLLTARPLLRLTLLRLTPLHLTPPRPEGQRHTALLTLHHIAGDGWSLGVLVDELSSHYQALREGRPSRLPALRTQYSDFARWQRGWLAGGRLERELAFWRRQLAGAPPVLELPIDHPRPPVRRQRGRLLRLGLGPERTRDLYAAARRQAGTPFMLLLSVFAALLGRISGAGEVVVGSPIAGRTRSEVEGLVGFFVNTLALRVDLGAQPSLSTLLARVRETTLAAYAHQHLPFEKLVEELQPSRDRATTPLFQVLLVLQNTAVPRAELPGLEARVEDRFTGTAKFDLTLSLAPRSEPGPGHQQLDGWLEYDADLFAATTIERWAGHLLRLLAGALAAPEVALSRLPLLSVAESHQLRAEWSAGPALSGPASLERSHSDRGAPDTLHALFHRQARARPEAVALVWQEEHWSFRALRAWSRDLALRLRRAGVGPEVRAGVLMERRPALVASLLGVLEAGGAYVPLDPAYPLERVSFMLADSRAAVLLIDIAVGASVAGPGAAGGRAGESASDLLADPGVTRLEIPPAPSSTSSRDGGGKEPRGKGQSEGLAYIIYTSGSTGRPKGVAIEHRSAVARLAWARESFQDGALEGTLAATSVCFDLSIFELFAPLASGGKVLLLESALALPSSPWGWGGRLLNTVPSAAAALLAGGGLPATVGTVNLAGEPLPGELVEQLYALGTVARVHNLYGPSEDTTYSTWARIPRRPPGKGGGGRSRREPRIGRPLPGSRAHVLDPHLQPVPLGVPGELFLAGVGLARGYLGRPGLTASGFVPDPFAGEPPASGSPAGGRRLYRTGDRVRHHRSGELEFLGRLDTQVKVRGFRIELGEVEARLREHPEVTEAVVVVRDTSSEAPEQSSGESRLIAYLAGSSTGGERSPEARITSLRTHLRRTLPEYMLPSLFMLLPALPRTPNGKVDRRALPAPEASNFKAEITPPRSPIEARIAALWSDLLGRAEIDVHATFFDLGGHSLLAARAVSRLRDTLGTAITVADFFAAPTVASLAARVLERRAEEGGMPGPLAHARASGAGTEDRDPGEPRRVPLSFAQRALWFLGEIDPESVLYNLPVALHLRGTLLVPRLARCLGILVDRHAVLRSRFPRGPEGPAAEILPSRSLVLPAVDLGRLDRGARKVEALRLERALALRPFDLEHGPLLVFGLLRLEPRIHHLLISLHHSVGDGWSLGVLLRELAALYREPTDPGTEPFALPDLPLTYADFARWQRAWLSSEVVEREVLFWRRRLDGVPTTLELPTDRPRPARRGSRGKTLPLRLPAALRERLDHLARVSGATSFMVLLAAFQVLLGRWSGQPTMLIGVPAANREHSELEGLVGYFANMLPLAGDLRGDPPLRLLLERVRDDALAAYSHQGLPFERLVDELAPARDPSRTPLFQVAFSLQNALLRGAGVDLPGLDVEARAVELPVAKFDLTLTLEEHAHGYEGRMEYSTGLFDSTSILRLIGAFERLLESFVDDPGVTVSRAVMLSAAEGHQHLQEWNDTAATYPRDQSIPALFATRAARAPEAIALDFAAEQISYGELARQSRGLAGRLGRAGVRPGEPVALLLDRSAELPMVLLAILQAGGAYVPLDLAFPAERLRQILVDSGARVLVTRRELADRLPEAPGWAGQSLFLGEPTPTVGGGSAPMASLPSTAPAYVLYTSGSTGRPKGVVVPHRAVSRLVLNTDYVRFTPAIRVAQVANTAFDAATFEIWGPLLNGGCVVGVGREEALEPRRLARALAERRVHALFLTTSLFNQVVGELPAGFAGVDTLLIGGEAADPASVWRALRAGPPARLLNAYGPTESTTFSTVFTVPAGLVQGASVPIGRPIANTQQLVLGRHGEVAPPGGVGELYLSGDGLAQGYLGRPALTAERFVPDPRAGAHASSGGRLYRTGDRVRLLPGGAVDFLGRFDLQVKIRGFRIEVEEIATALRRHPGVSAAVVVAGSWNDGRWQPAWGGPADYLAAYLVPSLEVGEDGLEESRVRRFLARSLPEFMVPSFFVTMTELPLNQNGKVDPRRLPPPRRTAAGVGASSHPCTPAEIAVAGIWKQLLELDEVDIHASFFELGGHSLLATRVVTYLREDFGVELGVADLFDAPTVADLARRVEELGFEAEPRPRPETLSRPGAAPVLSPAQERLWFLDQLQPGLALHNIAVALLLEGGLDVVALARSIAEISRRHQVLRTVIRAVEGRPVPEVRPVPPARVPVIDLTARGAERQLGDLLASEGGRGFDLARGPVLRVRLLRLGARRHCLTLTLHHIAGDGWSMGILLAELSSLYRAFRTGPASSSSLPELPWQYQDFSRWQRGWLSGERLRRQLESWRQRLQGAPALTELPTDRPRPPVQSFAGAQRPFHLPPALVGELAALARRQEASLFMALLAGLQALLGRLTGQRDLVVGSPVAGRRRRDVEGLIGFFVNLLPLRTDLSGDPSFAQLMGRVRETTLAAYADQDVPFERLVDALSLSRELTHTPLFQVLLVLQNTPFDSTELPGLKSRPIPVPNRVSQYDWTVALRPTGFGASGEDGALGDGGLDGSWDYATSLFDPTTIERWIRAYHRLLSAAVASPERPLSMLPLLGPAARQQLVEWNAMPIALPAERGETITARIAARAAARPDALAVVFEEEALSYGELARRAGLLAARLRRLGVVAEDRVGLFARRSLDMAVAVLGILEAGAAYLPLDPDYPEERLSYMLADAGARVVVAPKELVAHLPGAGVTVVDPGEPATPFNGSTPSFPAVPALPDSPVYVIYTSGSTGRPKGVVVTHRSLIHLARAIAQRTGLAPGDRVLGVPSLSFDASAGNLFPTWLRGATLVVHPDPARLSGASLRDLVERRALTLVDIPAALWAGWVDALALAGGGGELASAVMPSLRRVMVGGESLAVERVATWAELTGGRVSVLGPYGPTEATVATTTYLTTDAREVSASLRHIPIGRPLPGVRVHLVDRDLAPVLPGVTGELTIGGTGVARGYLGRPGRTAQVFLPDSQGRDPGARLYRTGDLARWLPDGNLQFLGRRDHQVKLRGFRIELGEIESALVTHPGVAAAVALVREDAPGARRLVAYAVMAAGESAAPDLDLQAWLRQRLPDYMVPSAFVLLEELPLTPNGKVDRAALPRPEAGTQGVDHAAPVTPAERVLGEVWGEVLGVSSVGRGDNFFGLGGDSILTLQVVARARQRGLELTPRDLFEHPSLAELAAAVGGSAATVPEMVTTGPTLDAVPLFPPRREREIRELAESLGAPSEDLYPLTPLQQGMLFHTLGAPGTGVYINQVSCFFEGPMDLSAFRGTWEALIRRHDVLRTAFLWEGLEEPVQWVRRDFVLPLRLVEMDPRAGIGSAKALETMRERELATAFGLSRAPLLRLLLVRLGPERHFFVFTHPHLLLDGWSIGRLFQEVVQGYEARHRAEVPGEVPSQAPASQVPVNQVPVEGPSPPFRRYLAWLAGRDPEAARELWHLELAGITGPTPLPLASAADHSGDQEESPKAKFLEVGARLSAATTRALAKLAQQLRITLNTLIQGLWALVLARAGGEDEALFGVTVAGRPPDLAGSGEMVGLFLNTLPLRLPVPAAGSALGPWLRAVQARASRLREVEWSSLLDIQAATAVPRGVPLFESIFVFENFPLEEVPTRWAGELQLRQLRGAGSTHYPLTFTVAPGEELSLLLSGARTRYRTTDLHRLLGQIVTALTALVQQSGDPERLPLEAITRLGPAERHQLIAEWNDTAVRHPRPWSEILHRPFQQRAGVAPDATALVFAEEQLSYGELDRRSGALARALRDRGVGPEAVVAVCLERSVELVVALYGILEAGGAYLPLDPDHPAERLRFMLEDSRPAALITQRSLAARVGEISEPEGAGAPALLCLDEIPLDGLALAPPAALGGENLAYVIYTSGSTGRPKGVMNRHRSIANRIAWMQAAYRLGPGDAVLQKTPASFDVSVWEFFWPLAVGARLVVALPGGHRDSAYLLRTLDEARITTLHFVPSMLAAFLLELPRRDEVAAPSTPSVRRVMTSGEALSRELVERFHARLDAELHNLYGPTEAAVDVTSRPCPTQAGEAAVPIGRPIANLSILLLDPTARPVPLGVAGQLHIGGIGLARGYRHRPALTAERFIPHPVAAGGGERLYRTGDLARHRPDGEIEFLGRIDFQVKIRGIRIELDEVAGVLSEHPDVLQAVVDARPAGGGSAAETELRLVAWVVPAPGRVLDRTDLRHFLLQRLPESMVPVAFAFPAALPLTASGKVDRRALPDIAAGRPAAGSPRIAPRTAGEERLAALWRDILGVAEVGVEDDFFALGGHSLAALRLLARLRRELGVDLSLAALLNAPTIAQLAVAVERARGGEAEQRVDLEAEAVLPDDLSPVPATEVPSGPPRSILLTGATGFVGAFLLDALLRHTEARVHCLVRAPSQEHAARRLHDHLLAQGLPEVAESPRITVLPGDLALPRLGLGENGFRELAGRIDTVLHNGALVNFALPYAAHQSANVGGTVEILRLAAAGGAPVHFISTLSVFPAAVYGDATTVLEADPLASAEGVAGGYVSSKWVGERLILEARDRGLPVALHRLGRVGWHSRSGAWNDADLMARLLSGCLALGAAPELDRLLDFTPVDVVSRAIVQLLLQPAALGHAFHVVEPRLFTWEGLLDLLAEAGAPLERLPYPAWRERVLRQVPEGDAHPLSGLRALVAADTADSSTFAERPPQLRFDRRNLEAHLPPSELCWPGLGPEVVRALLARRRPLALAAAPESL